MKLFVNYFQNVKSEMTNRIIKDEKLNEAAQNYIKAQTNFAHMLIDNTECVMKYAFDTLTATKAKGDAK